MTTTQDMIKGLLHQNAYQRLGALGAGLLNYDPRQPQSFGRSMGRGFGAMAKVPGQNPMQMKLLEMQIAKAGKPDPTYTDVQSP